MIKKKQPTRYALTTLKSNRSRSYEEKHGMGKNDK